MKYLLFNQKEGLKTGNLKLGKEIFRDIKQNYSLR